MEGPKDMPGSEPDELERLAEDWIALWQSEVAALAADRELAEAWAGWATATAGWWRGAMAARPPAMPMPLPTMPMPGWPFWPPAGMPGAAHDRPDAAARPAPPAPAPEPRHDAGHGGADDAAALRRRVEQLEQRLADLEGGAGGSGTDRRRPRRRAPPA
jgi:hypothetical protein